MSRKRGKDRDEKSPKKNTKQEFSEPISDLMQFSGTIDWPMSGLEYQRLLRDEWEK